MKVAIITDVHWGARNDSQVFVEFYKKFYHGVFFPELERQGIDTVLMLGDTFDRRKYTNHATIKAAKEIYFDELKKRNIKTYILIGNHDTFYKNTNEVNTIQLLLPEYDNLYPIVNAETIELDGTKICMVPWICAENYVQTFNEINTTKAEICMGHFEIAGFEMYRGHPSEGGLAPDSFSKFDIVYSGHYHHRSTKGNITYLGTPYELTWQDYADTKGFHIFDLSDRSLSFVPNPHTIFVRLEYDDKEKDPVELDALDLKDCFLKLVVVNKTDYYKFDKFVNKLYTKGANDIKIAENMSDTESSTIDSDIDLEDTLSILSNYIDNLQTEVNKDKIKTYMKNLYTEAINIEVT